MSEYRYVRLVSGESIVADIQNIEGDANFVKLILPLQVLLDRSHGLVMFPFLPVASSDDREITVNRNHILFTCGLTPKIAELLTKYAEKAYAPGEPKKEEAPKEEKQQASNLSDLLQQLDAEINSGKKPS